MQGPDDTPVFAKLGRHLAHELNNPVSAISSAAYLIEDFISVGPEEKIDGEAIRPFVESIREECMRLKSLIEEFTKYLTTDATLKGPLNLSEFLVARARENSSDGLKVTVDGPNDQGLSIQGDIGQLQYAFRSIAETAKEAGATEVAVGVKRENGVVQIEFQDNRPTSMSSEEASNFFATDGRQPGTGLGLRLPTVRKIIELHEGSIELNGRKPSGAVIRISIPVNGASS